MKPYLKCILLLFLTGFIYAKEPGKKSMNSPIEKIKILEEKLVHEPRNLLYRNNLAYFYSEMGEIQKAIQHYQAVLSIDQTYLPANYAMGNILLKQNKANEALFFYKKVLEKDSAYWQAHYGSAMAHQMNHDLDLAVQSFEKALLKEPGYADTYYYLAKCYEEQKNYSKAIRKYKEFTVIATKTKDSAVYLPFLNDAVKKVEELKNKIQ